MKRYLTFAISLLFCFQSFAQSRYLIKPENADCKKAIEIKDTLFGPTNAPAGYGEILEITGDKSSLYAFEKEHNTCWYYFKAKNDCHLELEIIPEKINDDYDFILYKYAGRTFCQDVADKKNLPVRSCISRNDKTNKSKTGLSKQAKDFFIHSGPGPSYSKSIEVRKGEVYYLCVDNVYGNGGGHTVVLHYSECKIPVAANNIPVKGKVNPADAKKASVTITFIDKETRKPVKVNGRIIIKSKFPTEPIYSFDSVSNTTANLPLNGNFSLKSEAINYFDHISEIKTNGTGQELKVIVEMSRIKVGQNVVFENILFFGNTAEMLPESTSVLEGIATTMKRNPGLIIEIHGHVNCPVHWPDCEKKTDFNNQLSINRAKAVYDYLIADGISHDRMTYKGFGATQMIYPDARSEDKMEKNRRVEIMVKDF